MNVEKDTESHQTKHKNYYRVYVYRCSNRDVLDVEEHTLEKPKEWTLAEVSIYYKEKDKENKRNKRMYDTQSQVSFA